MPDLASMLPFGALLVPVAILGIAARVRHVRARRARRDNWAQYDVPTFIRRRRRGTRC
jgi:hypothetical protein